MDGFFLVHKLPGITSSQVVQRIRKKLDIDKLGHTGTLDQFAEGLLVLPAGRATCFAQDFLEMDKVYIADLCLGKATDSGDTEGKVVSELNHEEICRVWEEDWQNGQTLLNLIENLVEWKEQEAPTISALKQDGKRLSDLHRSGVAIIPKIRKIRISQVGIIDFSLESIKFQIKVSSGTYIRKIVMDMGEKLNFPMSLKGLVRTDVGKFKLEMAKTIEDLEMKDLKSPKEMMDLPVLEVRDENHKIWVKQGRKPDLNIASVSSPSKFFLEDSDGSLMAYCEKLENDDWKYLRVF
ncbi:tRNA pseudouridine(55) synthase TruB [Leptospira sp. GIMC2001]|uniref:tRNA pseudouridine(55) synthase TruB n=1 Tax=Leptospira sp. GIMC2001 TaxID=1513297 RepID=UPI00234B9A69|nr:tRNA pseudouridine(55) synthase TruB [Leptospira sp. GIMC2001]WCL48087.1 tRNA pseudouridine(55) synthase TruB [Leptospira sp. GIMC2001]